MLLSYNLKKSIKRYLLLILEFICIAWVVLTIVFFLMNGVRGGEAAIDPNLSEVAKKIIRKKLGLDLNIWARYWKYLVNLVTNGQLGISTFLYPEQQVTSFLFQKIFVSFRIGFLGLLIAIIIGIPLGIYIGRKPGTWIDSLGTILIAAGFAIPSFVFAILLLLLAFKINIPYIYDPLNFFSWILPAIAIAIPNIAGYVRYLRTSIQQELGSQYVQFAKIKGCKNRRIIWRHVLKPSFFPIATFLPIAILSSIIGSIIIETVFAIPGSGQILIKAIQAKDYDVVMGVVLILSFVTVIGFFIRDILYTILDPRTRIN